MVALLRRLAPFYGMMHSFLEQTRNDIHALAIDYRGFGASTGGPLADALAPARFAMHDAGIPPDRIVVFGHSIGTVGFQLLFQSAEVAGGEGVEEAKKEEKKGELSFVAALL
ncbi:hypothetical protein B0T24DRAFT_670428 [Lasiosphaeria ovina]|uniref:AB hydrolase-1 domain-containing protein n=1 Tax=Lasiosphaeria ovina TaxID=92902 RepID=A0AAE0MZ84_9PEZI|nr:hypothetical protein B0T24DRAFT_670428 [Lasiosphaeria ovina]